MTGRANRLHGADVSRLFSTMVRRSTPQVKLDERAFPVRIKVWVPSRGFGQLGDAIYSWLERETGPGEYAHHPCGRVGGDPAVAFYFRRPGDADAFLTAFPALQLADGTECRTYSSPALPFGRRPTEDDPVCNLYSQTRNQEAIRRLFKGVVFADHAGNLEPGSIYPDQLAPIVRHGADGLELVRARWGMPSPPSVLKTARDPGVTNVRNIVSPHWRRWLGPAHRCLVPVTCFAEPRSAGTGNQWFAAADDVHMFFAGIEVRRWASTRKIKDGETTDDLFAFLTTEPNAEVKAVHPKAMPVILTTPAEWETWLSAPVEMAAGLQRPLPDGALRLIEDPV